MDNSEGRASTKSLEPFVSYEEVLGDGINSGDLPSQNLDHSDIINIQLTSGTTSAPKAACLTHRSILNNGKSIGDRMLLTENDIVCCPPPLFHCFGSILGYMATGNTPFSLLNALLSTQNFRPSNHQRNPLTA